MIGEIKMKHLIFHMHKYRYIGWLLFFAYSIFLSYDIRTGESKAWDLSPGSAIYPAAQEHFKGL